MSEERCPTKLLPVNEAPNDAFGSHEAIAKSIAEVVVAENDGRSIALTGEWGSGKSTILGLLQKKLREQTFEIDIEVFTFDAWSHEGEPLRRVFFQRLVQHFKECGWLTDARPWEKKAQELAGMLQYSSKNTEYLNVPTLAKWFALSFALLPVSIVMFKLGEYSGFRNSMKELLKSCDILTWRDFLKSSYYLIATVLGLMPGLFALLVSFQVGVWNPFVRGIKGISYRIGFTSLLKYIWLRCGFSWQNSPSEDKEKRNQQWNAFLSVLLKRFDSAINIEESSTPAATSVDFEEQYEKLLSEVLVKPDEQRKLLVVIDNLDRLDPGHSTNIWATMRTFANSGSESKEPALKNVWLIATFDESALKKLWTGEDSDVADLLVQSFMDKTFHLSFRAPKPLLSDWRQFLFEQLKIALPQHSDDEKLFNEIYVIFKRGNLITPFPTPRDIKSFVNKLGSLHRQWQHQILLKLQALYVALATPTWTPENDLLSKDISEALNGVPAHLFEGTNWMAHLAAIHYGCVDDSEKAWQAVLKKRLVSLMNECNLEELEKLKWKEGFVQVLKAHIIDLSNDDQIQNEKEMCKRLASIAKSIVHLEIADMNSKQIIFKSLSKALLKISNWEEIDASLSEGLGAYLKELNDPATSNHVLSKFSELPFPKINNEPNKNIKLIDGWLVPRFNLLKEVVGSLTETVDFFVNCDVNSYLEMLKRIYGKRQYENIWKYFRIKENKAKVTQQLTSLLNQGQFDAGCANALEVLVRVEDNWNFGQLIPAIKQKFAQHSSQNNHTAQTVLYQLGSLLTLASKRKGNALQVLKSIITGELVFSALSRVSGDLNTASLCAYLILRFLPKPTPNKSRGNPQANAVNQGIQIYTSYLTQNNDTEHAWNSRLAKRIYLLDDTPAWLLEITKANPVTTKRVQELLSNEAVKHRLSSVKTSVFIDHCKLIRQSTDEDFMKSLVGKFVQREGFLAEFATQEFDLRKSSSYELILASSLEFGISSELKEFWEMGLGSIPVNNWVSELSRPSSVLVRLIIKHQEYFQGMKFAENLVPALINHAERLVGKGDSNHYSKEEWRTLLGFLSNSQSQLFNRNLFHNTFIKTEAKEDLSGVISLYKDQLKNPLLFSERSEQDELFFTVFPNILKNARPVELEWMLSVLSDSNFKLSDELKVKFNKIIDEGLKTQEEEESQKLLDSLKKAFKPN